MWGATLKSFHFLSFISTSNSWIGSSGYSESLTCINCDLCSAFQESLGNRLKKVKTWNFILYTYVRHPWSLPLWEGQSFNSNFMWVLQIEGGAGDEGLQTFCSLLSDDIRLSQVTCHLTYDIDQQGFQCCATLFLQIWYTCRVNNCSSYWIGYDGLQGSTIDIRWQPGGRLCTESKSLCAS